MKSISPGTVTIGVLAIVFGLVGVYVARRALEPAPVTPLKPPPMVRAKPGPAVVYAKVNLPEKTRITSRDLSVRRLEAGEEAPADAIGSVAEIVGRITRTPIRAGSQMSDEILFDIGEGPNPADLIPDGYVSVPIKLTGAHVGNGMVRMGSRVNVAFTVADDDLEVGLVRTQTLLHDVLVIAASREDFERASPTLSTREQAQLKRENQQGDDEIIVAVSQADANKLITAQTYGTLSVTLRSFDGTDEPSEQIVSMFDILNLPKAEQPAIVKIDEAPPAQPAETYTVERWNGTSMELIEFPRRQIQEARDATIADRVRSGETVPVNVQGRPE